MLHFGLERTRRQLLRDGLLGMGLLAAGPLVTNCGHSGGRRRASNIANLGPLGAADENGLRLPAGFRSRIVARSTRLPLPTSAYPWHASPDGGAVFPTSDGGWVYVSNAEVRGDGGAGALRFAGDATLVDAYPVLRGTSKNCAGGPTPWGTWLSCEETDTGRVHECDPLGRIPAVVRPSLGVFKHEAAAVDPQTHAIYMTEDQPDGNFYRFVPQALQSDGRPDLTHGRLEVAQVLEDLVGPVAWHPLPDASALRRETRHQVDAATAFNGGEGIFASEDVVHFATKGDDRVWKYDLRAQRLTIAYDAAQYANPTLKGVDNVVTSDGGDVLVAEDKGNLEIVALTPGGAVLPVVQIVGHDDSEVTGPAFDPSGSRLYFSSQKGAAGSADDGTTFEVTGPFHI